MNYTVYFWNQNNGFASTLEEARVIANKIVERSKYNIRKGYKNTVDILYNGQKVESIEFDGEC